MMINQLGLLLLICAIIIIIVFFVLFLFVLKRQDDAIIVVDKIFEKQEDFFILFRNNRNEIIKLRRDIEDIKNKIDTLNESFEKQNQDSVKSNEMLVLVKEIKNQLAEFQSSLAFKEPISDPKEPISRIPQTLGVKSELSCAESDLIIDFNRMLLESSYEQDFRARYQQLAPALCNSNGTISVTVTADDEHLWIIPRSDHNNAFVLPSRRLLTKFLSTLLSNKGEGASTLIGSCFDVVVRDDLERAHLIRFAEAEIEHTTGQIIKARILKKGQLELPSGTGKG